MMNSETRKAVTMNENLMQHGRFSWSELMTTGVEAARQFYSALFGW